MLVSKNDTNKQSKLVISEITLIIQHNKVLEYLATKLMQTILE